MDFHSGRINIYSKSQIFLITLLLKKRKKPWKLGIPSWCDMRHKIILRFQGTFPLGMGFRCIYWSVDNEIIKCMIQQPVMEDIKIYIEICHTNKKTLCGLIPANNNEFRAIAMLSMVTSIVEVGQKLSSPKRKNHRQTTWKSFCPLIFDINRNMRTKNSFFKYVNMHVRRCSIRAHRADQLLNHNVIFVRNSQLN